jgi:hypothetical protein
MKLSTDKFLSYCMSESIFENYSGTIPYLKQGSQYLWSSSKKLIGDIYFDCELLKNNKIKNHRGGRLVGHVVFYLGDSSTNYSNATIIVDELHANDDYSMQIFILEIYCSPLAFSNLKDSIENKNQITIQFNGVEWEQRIDLEHGLNDYISNISIYEILFLPPNNKPEKYFEDIRVADIQNYLLEELCGCGDGQIPIICKEFSQNFKNQSVFNNRNILLEDIFDIVDHIKYYPSQKSELRVAIEEDDDSELSKLFELKGDKFDVQLDKIKDKEQKRELLSEYNTFLKRINSFQMCEEVHGRYGFGCDQVAHLYLGIPSIYSPFLNEILVNGLIGQDIFNTVNKFLYKDKMSLAAILYVSTEEPYNKTLVNNKNKTFLSIIGIGFVGLLDKFLHIGLRGVFIWFITLLLANDNVLAHYILFGTIFAADMIVTALNLSKTDAVKQDNLDEFNFYILRDMCALHKQAFFLNTKLLRHLMYKIEERGVQLNHYIYEILERKNKFES